MANRSASLWLPKSERAALYSVWSLQCRLFLSKREYATTHLADVAQTQVVMSATLSRMHCATSTARSPTLEALQESQVKLEVKLRNNL